MNLERKYEFTDAVKHSGGRIVRRIRATRDVSPHIKRGTLGGWLEKEANLSHRGESWVGDEAVVSGDACVQHNAKVLNDAVVRHNASVSDNVVVVDYATLAGDVKVSGYASVRGNAYVRGRAVVGGYVVVHDNTRIQRNAKVVGDVQLYGSPIMDGDVIINNQSDYVHILDRYPVTITRDYVHIGCQQHPLHVWMGLCDTEINAMGADALAWWRAWKPLIRTLAEHVQNTSINETNHE